MKILGHKNIKNTLLYVQLEEALSKENTNTSPKLQRPKKKSAA
jgi:hypothetical protein